MIISGLLSFLGGGAFRMIWGEFSAWISKKQDHQFEIERIKLQEGIDEGAHSRNLESLRLQSDLGIKLITVQSDVAISKVEVDAFLEGVKATSKKSGVRWIDGWNAVIRPGVATWAIVMMTLTEFQLIVMSENSWMVAAAALGIYLADRTLFKRGK
jgi:hypothetical protein